MNKMKDKKLMVTVTISGKMNAEDLLRFIYRVGMVNDDFSVSESWVINENSLRDSLLSLKPLNDTCETILDLLGESDWEEEIK